MQHHGINSAQQWRQELCACDKVAYHGSKLARYNKPLFLTIFKIIRTLLKKAAGKLRNQIVIRVIAKT